MATFTITQQPNEKDAYLYPSNDGCDIDCFPFGDTRNYLCVDDEYNSLTPDSDFVYFDGDSTVSDIYAFENHGSLSGTINYVKVHCRAKSDAFPPAHDFVYKISMCSDSGCTYFATSPIQNLSTGFTTFGYSWDENPFTTAAWTWGDIDKLQAGFEASSPSVIVSPFIMLPAADGDRTDIESVTAGYEHWEAVRAENPLTQITESGNAWAYDIYEYVMSDGAYYTSNCRACCKFGEYVVACDMNDTYIYAWRDGKSHYLTELDDGGYTIASDGNNHYFIGGSTHIYVLTYDPDDITLTETQDISDAGIQCQDLKYDGTYLYAACDNDGLIIYSVANDGTLTEVNHDITNTVYGVAVDSTNSYILISDSTDNKIKAYTWDGTTLTLKDDLAIADIERGFDYGGGYFYFPADQLGLKVYSFDGTTLTLEDTLDNGGHYSRVKYSNGYIHVLDLTVGGNGIRAYSFDGVNLTHEGTYAGAGYYQVLSDGDFICTQDTDNDGIILSFNGSNYDLVHGVENGMSPKYLTSDIQGVTVLLKMGKEYDAADEADIRGRAIIKTHGVEYTSDYVTLEYPKRWYAFTWSTNPNTSAAWTLAEVKALQAGVGLYGDGTKYAACSICHVAITSEDNVSPEFHTSQVYLKVNYSPPESTCTLTRPSEISFDHTRNINMLNFWSGNREVFDESRSNKSIVLRGKEVRNACSRIQCIRTMGENGATVTLNDVGWGRTFLDKSYRIRSFGWKHVQEKPDVYEWVLELEMSE